MDIEEIVTAVGILLIGALAVIEIGHAGGLWEFTLVQGYIALPVTFQWVGIFESHCRPRYCPGTYNHDMLLKHRELNPWYSVQISHFLSKTSM